MQQKDFYTPQEVADITGKTVLTVYRWIKDGKITAVKIGQWRIAKEELQRLLTEGTKEKK